MKWLAVLAVAMVLGIAALFVREAPVQPAQSPVATAPVPVPAAAPRSPAPAGTPAQSTAQPWQRVVLHGVLFQQHDAAASQALLSLDGQPVQVFHQGDQVLPGWALQAIKPDHVVVASGQQQHRLDVQPARAPPVVAAAASAGASGSGTKEVPLPGFIPSAATSTAPRSPPSVETNRRFVQDRQNRVSGAPR